MKIRIDVPGSSYTVQVFDGFVIKIVASDGQLTIDRDAVLILSDILSILIEMRYITNEDKSEKK
jgi:hypothetical protein